MAQPPPPPSAAAASQRWTDNPSDLREIQILRQELADTQKKLQGCSDTVISLYNELLALRENICRNCKERFAPHTATTSSSKMAGDAVSSSPSFRKRFFSSYTPVKPSTFWRRMLKGKLCHAPSARNNSRNHSPMSNAVDLPSPDMFLPSVPSEDIWASQKPTHIPVNSPPSTAESSSRASASRRELSVPRWSARRDATADAALDVVFVRSFILSDLVQSVRFSADGKCLAAALNDSKWHSNGTIIIYDVQTGKKTCELAEYASRYHPKARPGIRCVCFSPDGRYVVAGNEAGSVTVWDIPNKRICNVFRGHRSSVQSVDFSPNGRLVVSASWDYTVRIWNMRDGSENVFSDNALGFLSVRFSPDGQYVAAGNSDRVLRIWDVRTGRQVKRWAGHKGYIRSVAFTADVKGLVSGSSVGEVKRWDVSSLGLVRSGGESVPPEILEYRGDTGSIYSVAISPDAQWVVSTSHGNTAILWDTRSAVRQYTLIGHGDAVYSVDFSPAGTYLATGSRNGHVILWTYTGT